MGVLDSISNHCDIILFYKEFTLTVNEFVKNSDYAKKKAVG